MVSLMSFSATKGDLKVNYESFLKYHAADVTQQQVEGLSKIVRPLAYSLLVRAKFKKLFATSSGTC